MARIEPVFEAKTCREAVNVALNFCRLTGSFRPIPARIRTLIHVLTVAEFAGRRNTDESRIRLTTCLMNAVKPWRG